MNSTTYFTVWKSTIKRDHPQKFPWNRLFSNFWRRLFHTVMHTVEGREILSRQIFDPQVVTKGHKSHFLVLKWTWISVLPSILIGFFSYLTWKYITKGLIWGGGDGRIRTRVARSTVFKSTLPCPNALTDLQNWVQIWS